MLRGDAQPQGEDMTDVDTVIVGAGQAGLALSSELTDRGHEHVVLERGQVAERWRSERWDSFRLITPNWQTRLPGHRYDGPDPDGFMRRDEVVAFFDDYAASFDAPVLTDVQVESVRPGGRGWQVTTAASGTFAARCVVVATGHYAPPAMPPAAATLPASLAQLSPRDYRNPAALPDGAVLVVGAGPSGQQIASEVARSGRRTFIAVGQHRPLPRRYRGRDAYWWLDAMGSLERTIDSVRHPSAAAAVPSVVLSGDGEDLHLRRVVAEGAVAVGHFRGAIGQVLTFADDLQLTLSAADAYLSRFRGLVDDYVRRHHLSAPEETWPAVSMPAWALDAPRSIDVQRETLSTVIWATGYRRDYSWINADVFDEHGSPLQRRGVTDADGLMFLGLRYMYRRNSNFIDGVGADAVHLADQIAAGRGSAVA